jgi:hypothetical protein
MLRNASRVLSLDDKLEKLGMELEGLAPYSSNKYWCGPRWRNYRKNQYSLTWKKAKNVCYYSCWENLLFACSLLVKSLKNTYYNKQPVFIGEEIIQYAPLSFLMELSARHIDDKMELFENYYIVIKDYIQDFLMNIEETSVAVHSSGPFEMYKGEFHQWFAYNKTLYKVKGLLPNGLNFTLKRKYEIMTNDKSYHGKVRWKYIKNLWLQSWFGTWKIRQFRRTVGMSIWVPLVDHEVANKCRFWHEKSIFNKKIVLVHEGDGVVIPLNGVINGNVKLDMNRIYHFKISLLYYLLYLKNYWEVGIKNIMRKKVYRAMTQYIQRRKFRYNMTIYAVLKKYPLCYEVWRNIFSYIGTKYTWTMEGPISESLSYLKLPKIYVPKYFIQGYSIDTYRRAIQKIFDLSFLCPCMFTHKITILWYGMLIEQEHKIENYDALRTYPIRLNTEGYSDCMQQEIGEFFGNLRTFYKTNMDEYFRNKYFMDRTEKGGYYAYLEENNVVGFLR